jgi:endonuclease/exonuclease/phosphatase family metal-dependent hydrolase
MADRRPAQMMQRSGFHDAAPTLRVPWQATGGHRGDWRRREDVFWTTRPAALRGYRVIDTAAARALSDHLPIVVELDPQALAQVPFCAAGGQGVLAERVTP